MRRERSTNARASRTRLKRERHTIGTRVQLGLWVAAASLAACAVGGELESFDAYNPNNTHPDLTQSGTTNNTATATTTTATTTTATTTTATSAGGAAATTASSTTGGGDVCNTCDVDTAMTTCQGTVCHGSPGVATSALVGAGLDLFQPGRETYLLDAPATYDGVLEDDLPNCPMPAELLINSANPGASLMLTKINGTYACGTAMPQVGTLAAGDLDCITSWVTCIAGGGAVADGLEAGQQTGIGGSSSF